jgi:hypothetical protein
VRNRRAAAGQLTLFDLSQPEPDLHDEEDEMIALGILRHRHDLSDHQRGFIVLDWDTAGGGKKGDLIPAWICCVCGGAEPNQYWLTINHYCATIPGCARHSDRPRKGPWAFRLACAPVRAGPQRHPSVSTNRIIHKGVTT